MSASSKKRREMMADSGGTHIPSCVSDIGVIHGLLAVCNAVPNGSADCKYRTKAVRKCLSFLEISRLFSSVRSCVSPPNFI